MIEIDGGYGEGGGQIIRTALGLSSLLKLPFRIYHIRKNRPKPGLRAQHLAGVRAVKTISSASVEGDRIDSTELAFQPGTVKGGDYRFDIGTAGATPLVLQTLLPPLVFADAESHLVLSGGTHVPISPPMHFIREIFLPVLTGMGPEVKVSLRVYGFYPRGGGEVEAHVRPIMEGASLHRPAFPEKKSVWAVRGISAVANLPLSIAERQKKAAMEVLREIKIDTDIKVTSVSAPSPGTFVFLKAEGGACIAGFSSVGIRGKRAEVVGSEAASAFLQYYHRDGCIDPHLADQIVIYLALAPGTTSFTTTAITPHLLTNLAVIKKFLDVQYTVEGQVSGPGRISIRGAGYSRKCFSG